AGPAGRAAGADRLGRTPARARRPARRRARTAGWLARAWRAGPPAVADRAAALGRLERAAAGRRTRRRQAQPATASRSLRTRTRLAACSGGRRLADQRTAPSSPDPSTGESPHERYPP